MNVLLTATTMMAARSDFALQQVNTQTYSHPDGCSVLGLFLLDF